MARRTFAAIDAEVLLRLGNRDDVTSSQRAAFIRDATLNVAMLFRHPEIQKFADVTLSQGEDSLLDVIPDLWFPTFLRNQTDGYIITLESQERMEKAGTKPTARPYKYYWYGRVFYFDSLSDTDKTIRVWYKRKPVEFSGTDSSELDELFDPFIVMDAARIGFETVRDFDQAAVQLKLFQTEADRKKLPLDQAKLNDYRQGFRPRVGR